MYRIPLAIERYQKEILRVFGVLESVLSKQEWLIGGKYSVADLSFVMYVPVSLPETHALLIRRFSQMERNGDHVSCE